MGFGERRGNITSEKRWVWDVTQIFSYYVMCMTNPFERMEFVYYCIRRRKQTVIFGQYENACRLQKRKYLYLKSIKKCNTYCYLTCRIYTTLFKNQIFASATYAVFGLPSVFVLNVHPHVRSYANIHRTGHCKYGSIYLLL